MIGHQDMQYDTPYGDFVGLFDVGTIDNLS